MTTTRTTALGGDFPQGNETKAPARDEGERTNERLRDKIMEAVIMGGDAWSITGATAVAWRFKVAGSDDWELCTLDPRCDTTDFAAVQPLYAAPVAEGAREKIARIIVDGTGAVTLGLTDAASMTAALPLADAILQALDTGTNRGGPAT